jgi:hypothetical protein
MVQDSIQNLGFVNTAMNLQVSYDKTDSMTRTATISFEASVEGNRSCSEIFLSTTKLRASEATHADFVPM